ncbi:MAG TPA: hypothetical protein VEO74_08510 [Thermoanaerobaculia bacterium]|nr:hypothetical protein [Thermoanaerobaculia bacterium]
MFAAALLAVILAPAHYGLTLSVDYKAEVLHGKARIELQNPSAEPVREASFLLYRLMKVTKGGKFTRTSSPSTTIRNCR